MNHPFTSEFRAEAAQLRKRLGLAVMALAIAAGLSVFSAPLSAAEEHSGAGNGKGAANGASALMRYREGEHYLKVPIPMATVAKDGVEVVEFFSYGCIHCFNFDPMLDSWSEANAEGVAFRRIPAVFNQSWAFLAQAFYTAEALGVSEALHQPLFRAIHTDNINIGDPELMAALFQKHGGVAPEDFAQAFDSFGVRSKVQQATAQGRALRLRAVPSLVVAGQYVVDGSMVEGGNAEMLKVVEYLIDLSANAKTETVAAE